MNRENQLARIVRALNDAMLDQSLWPQTSALIDRACGVGGGALSLAEDVSTHRVDVRFARCFCRGVERRDWVRDYFERFYAEDELVPRMRRLPDSRIVPFRRLYSEKELKRSRAWNEAMARYHMQDGLIVRLEEPGNARIIWGLGDPLGRDGWSSSRIETVARILPHLRQYVRVHSTLAEAGALGATALGLLENTHAAVVQLDRRGRVAAANDRAREILLRNDGISDPAGFLRAAAPEDDARLQALLARALPRFGDEPESGSTWVRRVSQRPSFVLHLTPVSGPGAAVHPRRVAAILLIVDPASAVRPSPGLLQSALGLTPAESEVAQLLAGGMSARRIASATGRRYGTVRVHLKRIFTKLGVSRQADAVRIVLSLSQFPPSPE